MQNILLQSILNTMLVYISVNKFNSLTVIFLFLLMNVSKGDSSYGKDLELKLANIKLSPCQACKMVVDSFLKGMERTARNHFGGGDTAWEEEKLGSYANSEVRLVEIQEHLCGENRARDQCLTLAEDWEQYIEDWWLSNRKETPDLMHYLCIDTVKHCCPVNHFGPSCQPCPGYPDQICNNNGICKGNGTRKGSGQCSCMSGYTGKFCDECAPNYYTAYNDEKKLICSQCHSACDGPCTGPGSKGCLACNAGWVMDPEKGCLDINECFYDTSPCKKTEFCVNNEGSYVCYDCDPSCEGCSGDGPDMCEGCAAGYVLKDNMCVHPTQEGFYSNTTRYLTYVGLCVATCIIFQNSPILASGVALFVAIYVGVSEYMLGSLPNNILSTFLNYFKS